MFHSADDALRGMWEMEEFLTNPHGPQMFTTKRVPAKKCCKKGCDSTEFREMVEWSPRDGPDSPQYKVTRIRCREPSCHAPWQFSFEFVRKIRVDGASRRGDHDQALALMATVRNAFEEIPHNDRCIWVAYTRVGGIKRTADLLNTDEGLRIAGLHHNGRFTYYSVRESIARARARFETILRRCGLLIEDDPSYAEETRMYELAPDTGA